MNNTTKALLIISGALLLLVWAGTYKPAHVDEPVAAHTAAVPARRPVRVLVCVRSLMKNREVICETLQMGMSLAEVEALLPQSHARALDTVTTGADGTEIALRLFFSLKGEHNSSYVSMTFYNDQLAQVSQ